MSSRKYNTRKIRTFLLFLGLACVIWILTKFSQDYTATLDGDISYSDLPDNAVLSDANTNELSFEVTANGFKFLQYQLNKPKLDISLAGFEPDEDDRIVLDESDLSRLVSEEMGNEVSVSKLSLTQLVVEFDRLASKTVPVVSEATVNYRE